MPIYDIACPQCDFQIPDRYFKVVPSPTEMPVCGRCGVRMAIQIGLANPLTHTYAEDRPFLDHNISRDGRPVVITSWEQRRKLMRERNLEEPGVKRGMPGCWA